MARGVIKLAKGSKRQQWDLKPGSLDRESGLLTGMLSHPLVTWRMVNEDEHSEVEMRCRIQQERMLGKGRGSHVGQKHFEKSEKESIFFYLVPQYTYVNRPKYHL